ncbi:hypothetical protein [Maritalea sp.]|uniref:hypothetical protein n=1 Tax=Maritalea sp. TaxID=2003361 RepID=UPI003F4AC87F
MTNTFSICPTCEAEFTPRRSNQKYCSENCRKANYQRKDRLTNPKNSWGSPTKRYDNRILFDRTMLMTEKLYSMKPSERLGYIKGLIDEARSGNSDLREILTNKYILGAGPEQMRLFWRQCRAYPNIVKCANSYCRKFWNAGVIDVVKGIAPEPETGELVFESYVTLVTAVRQSETFLGATLEGLVSKPSSPYIKKTLVLA